MMKKMRTTKKDLVFLYNSQLKYGFRPILEELQKQTQILKNIENHIIMKQFNVLVSEANEDIIERHLEVQIGIGVKSKIINKYCIPLNSGTIEDDEFVVRQNQKIIVRLHNIKENGISSYIAIERKIGTEWISYPNLDIAIIDNSDYDFPDKEK